MTNSATETIVLDDEAVAEIEARANAATELPSDGSAVRVIYDHGGGRMYVQRNTGRDLILDSYNRGDSEFYFHAREDVPALCQTVRVLRAEMKTQKVELLQLSGRGELLAKVHVNFDDLDPLAAVRNEFDRLRNIVIRDLLSQLEQVTKERDTAREVATAITIAKQKAEQSVTSMRSACVEAIRGLLAKEVNGHCRGAYSRAITALESVSIQEREPHETDTQPNP